MLLIKSPLRYPGGKSRAIKLLKEYFPYNFIEYREPFFGGGSVGIYLAQIYAHKNISFFANDLNYDVYCFWDSLRNNANELIAEIDNIKRQYKNGRELYNLLLNRRDKNQSKIQKAIDFFVLNRITFSGVVDCGGYSEAAFKTRFTQSCIDRLKTIQKVVKKFLFSSNDYKELIQKSGDNVFIFLDPPYFSATKSKLYGKKGDLHTGFNHEECCEILRNTKHHFLLTYDNSDYIKNLYKDFYIKEYSLQYGMNNYKQEKASCGKELLISNYEFVNTHRILNNSYNKI